MTYRHAIVWLDHREASIVEFSASHSRVSTVTSDAESGKLHLKSGIPGSGKAPDDVHYFDAIVAATPAEEVLIVGPGTAKTTFERYARDHHPDFAARIAGVETIDHPSHGQLLAHGRKFFQRIDRLAGNVVLDVTAGERSSPQ